MVREPKILSTPNVSSNHWNMKSVIQDEIYELMEFLEVKPHTGFEFDMALGSNPLLQIWRQSYKRNLVLKKSKFVLNLLTVCYLNLDLTTVLLQ